MRAPVPDAAAAPAVPVRTFGRLFLLFLTVPVVDLVLLVWVGERLGFWPTVGTVVLTALVGSWLARREGSAAWRRVQARLSGGGVPGPELVDGLVILVAGALLLTPGFVTDLVGLLGLLPPSRALMRTALSRWFKRSVEAGRIRVAPAAGPFGPAGFGPTGFGAPVASEPGVEDAEIVEETSRPLARDGASAGS